MQAMIGEGGGGGALVAVGGRGGLVPSATAPVASIHPLVCLKGDFRFHIFRPLLLKWATRR